MKKIRILIATFTLFTFFMVGCSEDTKVESGPQTTVSPALRIALNNMLSRFIPAAKMAISTEDDNTEAPELCFDFVYPITLSYNTGTTVTVNSLDEIVELLQAESGDSYLNGIAFPFQIQLFSENVIITIENENGFEDLNFNCGGDDDYYDDDFMESECFEFQFPFSVVNVNNQVIEIADMQSFYNLFEDENAVEIMDFVYPFNLTINGQTVVINNMYQFSDILSDCYEYDEPIDDEDSDCGCNYDYAPVCIVYENTVVTFPNACVAICEGFNESDFVDCE